METKYVRVPFDLQLAKEITNGTKEGRIVTRGGESIRILCFDRKTDMYPIISLVDVKNQESVEFHDLNGRWGDEEDDVLDIMLEIPEYMTFKDGDVLTCYGEYKWIFIYRESNYKTGCYVTLDVDANLLDLSDYQHVLEDEDIKEIRPATDKEKNLLIKSLKNSQYGKAKEYLNRFFPNHSNSSNIGKKFEFNPFDKVLVRDNGGFWICSLFSHISKKQYKYKYITVTGFFENCIPYNEQTAHLLGTTENYE